MGKFIKAHQIDTDEGNFDLVMAGIPIGSTLANHWNRQNLVDLEMAAKLILTHGANPWPFTLGSYETFKQFASQKDWKALWDIQYSGLDLVLCGEDFY